MYQQKLAKKVAKYQRKVSDFHVEQLGTEQSLIRLEIEEDRYGDREFSIISQGTITGIINWPGNEMPIVSNTTNTNNNLSLHLYDLLPVEGNFKWETEINFGDILLQKIKVNPILLDTDPLAFRLMALQVVDLIGKASVELVYKKYELAPYTLDVGSVDGLQDYIDEYLAEPW